MRKLLLILISVYIPAAFAQKDVETFFNNEATYDGAASEQMNSEPLGLSAFSGVQSGSQPDVTPETDLTVSAEGTFSEYSKRINIPHSYRWKEWSFSAMIPYYMSKDYPGDFSVSGIGDMVLGISYGRYIEAYGMYFDGNLSVKAPTGDPEAEDGAAVIPLGTDTWDIAGTVSAYYFRNSFTYRGSVLYKFNGSKESETSYFDQDLNQDVSVERTDNLGDIFVIMAGADYRTSYRLTYSLNVDYGIRTDNSTDEKYSVSSIPDVSFESGKLIYADICPAIKYPYSMFEFVLGAKVPVYTDEPDNNTNDGKRSTEVRFRTNYRIF